MVCFDTNVLVYATFRSHSPRHIGGARSRLTRNADGSSILLLQTLAEFSGVTQSEHLGAKTDRPDVAAARASQYARHARRKFLKI
jgi:predicted nucleic acid-binding protein